MRLSDVRGERTFDVIADCIGPVANIAGDPTASRLFKRERLPEGKTTTEFMLEKLEESLPALMKDHKKDVIAILSSIEGVSRKKYTESLTMTKLINDCLELLTDEAFLELFTSAQSGTGGSSSTSAQGSTEVQKA